MTRRLTIVLGLLGCAFSASGATVDKPDFPGCSEFKAFPAGAGCVISECGAKRTDSVRVQLDAEKQENVVGPSAFVKYSCPSATLDSVTEQVSAVAKAAGFTVIYQDKDPAERLLSARKDPQTLDMDASPADSGGVYYTLTLVESGAPRPLTGEICSGQEVFTLPQGCALTDCNAKRRDKAEMRTTAAAQAVLDGPLRISGFACAESVAVPDVFAAAQTALKAAGFEVVFTDLAKPDYSWLTGRSGKRWVELLSTQESEGIVFQLSDIVTLSVSNK